MKTETTIKPFSRVVNVGTLLVYARKPDQPVTVWLKIEYRADGELSICGVVGPRSDGNAWGGCGQITDTLKDAKFSPAAHLGAETVGKIHGIWEAWHLNHMRAGCEHQRAAKWHELGRREVTLYHWWLTDEASAKRKAAREAATAALEKGETFTPTKAQQKFAALPEWLDTWSAEAPTHYESHATTSYSRPNEKKALGWLRPDEHPEGFLCKPCPECGYKYGSAWLKEEVPGDVLGFLSELPQGPGVPAWV